MFLDLILTRLVEKKERGPYFLALSFHSLWKLVSYKMEIMDFSKIHNAFYPGNLILINFWICVGVRGRRKEKRGMWEILHLLWGKKYWFITLKLKHLSSFFFVCFIKWQMMYLDNIALIDLRGCNADWDLH